MKLKLSCDYRIDHLTKIQKLKLIIYGNLHDSGFISFEYLFSKYVKFGVIDMETFWKK